MSVRTALATLEALVMDETVGLRAQLEALASSAEFPSGTILTDVQLVPWKLAGVMHAANTVNICVRPLRWITDVKQGNHRDGVLELAYETFASDATSIQANVAAAAVAVAKVADAAREYSDNASGPIIDFLGRGDEGGAALDFSFGDFEGGATSAGFIMRALLSERSSE